MRKEEYPCVSTSAIRLCVCVWPHMYYRLKGGKRKMRHSETDSAKWQKTKERVRDHHGSKKFATMGGE